MTDTDLQYVDGLNLIVLAVVGMPIFAGTTAVLESAIGPALTYGGNLCRDSDGIVAVCGTPPLGLVVATGVAILVVSVINNFIVRRRKRGDNVA